MARITTPQETIGKKIARLRQENGWTQQALATRLAISRVAVSHIEMDLTIPGERTITLIAGILKLTPLELVQDTTYPSAKAERLPLAACSYTPLEVELVLLENDLVWLERINSTIEATNWKSAVWLKWNEKLEKWREDSLDDREREDLKAAWEKLAAACRRI